MLDHDLPQGDDNGVPAFQAAGPGMAVIINGRSGPRDKENITERVTQVLQEQGVDAHVRLVHTGEELLDAAAQAAAGNAEVVVAGGGDGTIATVASTLLDTRKTLGVLPLGTFNYFAQRIGVPLDLEGALDVLASGAARTLSVGEVNGRVFLNNASIGMYPAVLRRRETTYRHVGRSQAAAYLSVGLVLLRPPGFMKLHLNVDGAPLARRTPLVFVGVNPHQLSTFDIPGNECAEAGRLALYITRPLGAAGLTRLALRAFFRGLHGANELEVICANELVVSGGRPRIRVAMDGEVARLRSPLRFRFRKDALRVLAPPGSASASP